MSARRRKSRVPARLKSLMGLVYALSAAFLPALHDHDGQAHRSPEALAGCADGSLHWAGHADAPDLSQVDDPCVACADRAEHLAPDSSNVSGSTASADCHTDRDASVVHTIRPVHSTRGPPRV